MIRRCTSVSVVIPVGNLDTDASFFLILRNVRQILIHVQIESTGHALGLAHILEGDRLTAEQFLEHIRNLKLSPCGRPLAGVLTILILGDIDGVVHQAHPVISSLMLKGVAVLLAVVHDELDDFRSSIGDLDGVGLDVGNSKAPFLDLMLEVDHEQGSALGNDIVFVPVVPEGILETG